MRESDDGTSQWSHDLLPFSVEAGKALEADVNNIGPGECAFLQCDVQNEDEIKVACDTVVTRTKTLKYFCWEKTNK